MKILEENKGDIYMILQERKSIVLNVTRKGNNHKENFQKCDCIKISKFLYIYEIKRTIECWENI